MTRYALWSLVASLGVGSARAGDAPPRFERDVLPILRARCLKCHGTADAQGGAQPPHPRGDARRGR